MDNAHSGLESSADSIYHPVRGPDEQHLTQTPFTQNSGHLRGFLEQLRGLLRSPALIADVVPKATALDPSLDEAKVTVGLTRLDAIWDELFPVEQHRLVSLLVEKVVVSPNELELRLRTNGIERVLLELNTERCESKVAA